MTVQFSTRVRNARADAIDATIGASPQMELRSGAQPANPAAAETGIEVSQLGLPASWMVAAVNGVKAKNGSWTGAAAAAGAIGHFRVKDNADSQCDMQGSVTGTGGGGDMELDNVNAAVGQPITINTFTITEGNA
ncbi:MAG: hypothetical protein AAFY29_22790 [Pseudomonadota bacterium]